ncbi:MAG TPA: hypothetical protein VFU05_02725 [Cyclobacteriaceae bacterium]|nr:hypothetical protein [Cyclobacteriaceae bacterium]
MIKTNLNSIKKLSKKEQKAIVGGACSDGSGYPQYCPSKGYKTCESACPGGWP